MVHVHWAWVVRTYLHNNGLPEPTRLNKRAVHVFCICNNEYINQLNTKHYEKTTHSFNFVAC